MATGTFVINCKCGLVFTAAACRKTNTCPTCSTVWYQTANGTPVGADERGNILRVSPVPSVTTRDRLSAEWEAEKHKLPDGELKKFICLAIMRCMEEWRGGEPPKPRPLTVTLVTAGEHECEFAFNGKTGAGIRCIHCGCEMKVAMKKHAEMKGPISPYFGFNNI
jgi:hypothetical protein